jgi:Tol biopolymer transport system component
MKKKRIGFFLATLIVLCSLPLLFLGCWPFDDDDDNNQGHTSNAIVFMSDNNSVYGVWGMLSDGSGKGPIVATDNSSFEAIQGQLSPNGRKLLYVKQTSGIGSQIIVRDLKTEEETVLVTDNTSTGNDFAPTWKPNGQMIAFHDDRDDGIHVINADGTGDLLLPGTGGEFGVDHSPSWNSSGSKIIFDRGWNGGITYMNADGSHQVVVIAESVDYRYAHPKFLSDGRVVATRISNVTSKLKDIVLMNSDGSGETNLTPGTDNNTAGTSEDFFPSVSGKKIAFSTSRNGGKYDIYVGTLSGNELTNLVNLTEEMVGDSWRPAFGYVDKSYAGITP